MAMFMWDTVSTRRLREPCSSLSAILPYITFSLSNLRVSLDGEMLRWNVRIENQG